MLSSQKREQAIIRVDSGSLTVAAEHSALRRSSHRPLYHPLNALLHLSCKLLHALHELLSSNSHKLRMISKYTMHTMRWQQCCAATNRLRWCEKYACSAATQNSHTTVLLLHCDERKCNCNSNTAIVAYLGQANVPLCPPRLCGAQKECKRQEANQRRTSKRSDEGWQWWRQYHLAAAAALAFDLLVLVLVMSAAAVVVAVCVRELVPRLRTVDNSSQGYSSPLSSPELLLRPSPRPGARMKRNATRRDRSAC
jgi:hypothetical protein